MQKLQSQNIRCFVVQGNIRMMPLNVWSWRVLCKN